LSAAAAPNNPTLEVDTTSASSGYSKSGCFFCTALMSSQHCQLLFGRDTSDALELRYDYSGSGSASNVIALLVTGTMEFRLWGDNTIQQYYSTVFTVSTLPTCNSAAMGKKTYVSDATSPTYLGALSGGGSTWSPAICNGSGWISGG